MNLLFYQYGSICEPDIISAFQELGFHVDTITEEIYDKSIDGKKQIALMNQALQNGNHQFVFTINFFPAISEICNLYHIPYLSLIVDSPVMELYSDSIARSWNRIFLFDRMLYEEFAPYNPGCIFHLPLATNVRRWDSVLAAATEKESQRFSSNLSFVGSLYSEKCPYYNLKFPSDYEKGYLEGLLNAQEKVYGYFFLEDVLTDKFVADIVAATPDFYAFPEKARKDYKAALCQLYLGPKITEMERTRLLTRLGRQFPVNLYSGSDVSHLPLHACGRVKTHTEMPLVFHNSRINLNITAKSIRSGIPLRVWDVLGCQGFLISNYQAEIPEHFVPGEDLILYSSPEELLELCAYYLEHPEACHEIAVNGYQKIKEFHTWEVRLTQILKAAFSI